MLWGFLCVCLYVFPGPKTLKGAGSSLSAQTPVLKDRQFDLYTKGILVLFKFHPFPIKPQLEVLKTQFKYQHVIINQHITFSKFYFK